MATNYPSALDTAVELPSDRTDGTTTVAAHASDHNNLADAVRALEAELGTDPSGSYATLKARLDAMGGNVSARIRGSADQTIQASKDTLVTLDTLEYDSGGVAVQSATNLTGTVAKNGTNTLTGTGTLFATELAVGDFIDVPGGGFTERQRVSAIASNTSLTVTDGFINTAAGQTAQRVAYGLKAVEAGVYLITAGLVWDTGGTGNRDAKVYANNNITGFLLRSRVAAVAGVNNVVAPSATVKLALNDIVKLTVVQSQGAAISLLQDGSASPSLAMTKIAKG